MKKVVAIRQKILITRMLQCLGSRKELAEFLDIGQGNIKRYIDLIAELSDEKWDKCESYLRENFLAYEDCFITRNPFCDKSFSIEVEQGKSENPFILAKCLMKDIQERHPGKVLEENFLIFLERDLERYWPYKESQSEEDTGTEEVATSSKQEPGKIGKTSD